MAATLPDRESSWVSQAEDTRIPRRGLLTAANLDFQSGSKFTKRDFLYLHILHQQSRVNNRLRQVHQDIMPPSTISEVTKVFDASPNIKKLASLLSPARVRSWSCDDIADTAQFAVGLEFLYSIIVRPKKESPPDDPEYITKITTPRKTRSMATSSSIQDISTGVSKLSFSPKTPGSTSDVFNDSRLEDSIVTEASSTGSVVDHEMDDIRKSYEREIFEVGDEQTVNACLVALIKPVAWMLGLHQRVHLDRFPFRVQDSGNGNYLYEARVDGIITDGKGTINGFLEAKRGLRQDRDDVRMQESAQMAALIHNDKRPLPKGETRKRWMVSMGGYQGYITIATYDHDYVEFLMGKSEPQSFMKMLEYGPFDLRLFKFMRRFLENIAILMRSSEAEGRTTDEELK